MSWHDVWLGVRLLLVLAAANTSPIIVKRWIGDRWNGPLDQGLLFFDGRPVLGPKKTIRGVIVAIAAAAVVASILQIPLLIGAAIGGWAMIGDALSSFIKRRLNIAPSARARGLDQIPEALLPLLAVRTELLLSPQMIAGLTLAFFLLQIPLARWTHRLGLREQDH